MPAARAYLDYNATAPLRAEARDAMVEAHDAWGNPNSIHAEGRRARGIVEEARACVAALTGAAPDGVVFTSGGTEAAQLALSGFEGPVAISAIEHDAVRMARCDAAVLPVDGDGLVSLDAIAKAAPGTLISVMAANNETGVMQPMAKIADICLERGLVLHTDAVQTAGRIAETALGQGAHLATISAHKLGGPKGVGALAFKNGFAPRALVRGGGQERGLRGGTENVVGIAGFGAAARAALRTIEDWRGTATLRDWIETRIDTISRSAAFAGRGAPRLPNTTCFAVPGIKAQTALIGSDLEGVAIGAGAACASGKTKTSHVLRAMGWREDVAACALRVSLGPATTRAEAERFIETWARIAARAAPAAAA